MVWAQLAHCFMRVDTPFSGEWVTGGWYDRGAYLAYRDGFHVVLLLVTVFSFEQTAVRSCLSQAQLAHLTETVQSTLKDTVAQIYRERHQTAHTRAVFVRLLVECCLDFCGIKTVPAAAGTHYTMPSPVDT